MTLDALSLFELSWGGRETGSWKAKSHVFEVEDPDIRGQ